MKKTVYVTNKDLLREIHNSKKSYCWFAAPEYSDYHVIVSSLDEITPDLIEATIQKHLYPKGRGVAPLNLSLDNIVFRVMTYDHIPIDPDRKRKTRNMDFAYAKTNFAPFKHFIKDGPGYKEVGRSHWKGDLESGSFSAEHGAMTRALANMYILIVERYARRGNWRNYSYNDEMRSSSLLQLAYIGLQFDESKSENPFAFYTTIIKNAFTRHLLVERRNQTIRDDLLIVAGTTPSFTRQIEHEMEQRNYNVPGPIPSVKKPGARAASPTKAEPKKPGRKPKITA